MSCTIRLQRARLAGRPGASSAETTPRAGLALGMMMSWAPPSAASIGVNECQASSQIRIAARPHRVSNACTAPARLDEPLLVEHAVGRQEDLAVDVPDAGVGAAERGVEAGVEEPVLVHLVEAEGDVERRGLGVAVLAGEVVRTAGRR